MDTNGGRNLKKIRVPSGQTVDRPWLGLPYKMIEFKLFFLAPV